MCVCFFLPVFSRGHRIYLVLTSFADNDDLKWIFIFHKVRRRMFSVLLTEILRELQFISFFLKLLTKQIPFLMQTWATFESTVYEISEPIEFIYWITQFAGVLIINLIMKYFCRLIPTRFRCVHVIVVVAAASLLIVQVLA